MATKKIFEVAMVLSASDRASRTIAESVAKQKKSIDSLNGAGDKAFAVGRTSGAIGLSIIAPLGLAVNAAEESEIAFKRLSSTFKTMGETDDRAATSAANYASELQTRIGVEDEEIQMVQSKIASFRKVSDETARMSGIFDRATEAAFDLAAGGFGEASGNAVQLGKALQNPAIGATALAKAGALNKSDIPLIKQIQATRGLGAAQEYVLKAVERQVKGQAANTATAASKMKIQFGEVAETVGRTLLPSVTKAMAAVGKAVNTFNNWAQANPALVSTIAKLTGGLGLLSLAISASSFVFGGLFKTIAFGRTLINGLRTAQLAYTIATATGAGVTGGMTAAMTALNLAFLMNPITWIIIGIVALIAVGYQVIKNWDKVSQFFKNLWTGIKLMFSQAWEWIKNIFLNYTPHGLIIKHWDKISAFFVGLWDKVKGIFSGFISFLLGLPGKFFQFGSDIIMGVWNGIKSKATALFDYVKDVGKKIGSAFKSVLGINSPSKVFAEYGVNITEGAKQGIQKGSPSAVAASSGMGKAMKPNSTGSSAGSFSGGGMTVNFAPVINGGNASDISFELRKLMPQLMREIESAMERKKRLAF